MKGVAFMWKRFATVGGIVLAATLAGAVAAATVIARAPISGTVEGVPVASLSWTELDGPLHVLASDKATCDIALENGEAVISMTGVEPGGWCTFRGAVLPQDVPVEISGVEITGLPSEWFASTTSCGTLVENEYKYVEFTIERGENAPAGDGPTSITGSVTGVEPDAAMC